MLHMLALYKHCSISCHGKTSWQHQFNDITSLRVRMHVN